MKKIAIIIFVLAGFAACDTRQDVIDTGISSPYFEGNMMEYLRSDAYNWELTVQMIERAGLTDLFEGRVDSLSEITFLLPRVIPFSVSCWIPVIRINQKVSLSR
nr:hypothetical protein [uncultured Butyricimonas sp.]